MGQQAHGRGNEVAVGVDGSRLRRSDMCADPFIDVSHGSIEHATNNKRNHQLVRFCIDFVGLYALGQITLALSGGNRRGPSGLGTPCGSNDLIAWCAGNALEGLGVSRARGSCDELSADGTL